jgi:putative DNA topoisomerase
MESEDKDASSTVNSEHLSESDMHGNTDSLKDNPLEYEAENYGICPECGSDLKLIATRRGLMLGCSGYPKCRYMTPFVIKQVVTIERMLEGTRCPECGYPMAVKSGRYGQFISCSNYPECHYVFKDRQSDDIPCPECDRGVLQVRKTRFNKVFWGCSNYPDCK